MSGLEDTLFYRTLARQQRLQEQQDRRSAIGQNLANAQERLGDREDQYAQQEQQLAQAVGQARGIRGQTGPSGMPFVGGRAGAYEQLGQLEGQNIQGQRSQQENAAVRKLAFEEAVQRYLEQGRNSREKLGQSGAMERLLAENANRLSQARIMANAREGAHRDPELDRRKELAKEISDRQKMAIQEYKTAANLLSQGSMLTREGKRAAAQAQARADKRIREAEEMSQLYGFSPSESRDAAGGSARPRAAPEDIHAAVNTVTKGMSTDEPPASIAAPPPGPAPAVGRQSFQGIRDLGSEASDFLSGLLTGDYKQRSP